MANLNLIALVVVVVLIVLGMILGAARRDTLVLLIGIALGMLYLLLAKR